MIDAPNGRKPIFISAKTVMLLGAEHIRFIFTLPNPAYWAGLYKRTATHEGEAALSDAYGELAEKWEEKWEGSNG